MTDEESPGTEVPKEREIELKLSWVGFDEAQIVAANQFVSQALADGMFVISFGMAKPPLVVGTPEQQHRQLSDLSFVPVETLCRMAVTPESMRRLIELLQLNLAKHDKRSQFDPSG